MAFIRVLDRKKGRVFRAEVYNPAGVNKSRTFNTRREALDWGKMQELRLRADFSSGVVPSKITVREFFDEWMENYAKKHHSPGWLLTDRQIFRDYVDPWIGGRKVSEVTPNSISRLLGEMIQTGLAPSYANRVRQLLSVVFREAARDRVVASNPVAYVTRFEEIQKTVAVLSKGEATRLLLWCDNEILGIGIQLALQVGLREGEVAGLRWDAVDLANATVCVRRKWCKKTRTLQEYPKSKVPRSLGLTDGLVERLKQKRTRHPEASFVVCHDDNEMAKPHELILFLQRGIAETGIKRVTFHGLRHSFASLYMQSGGDLYDLQKILGHSSVSTTERYRHTDPEYLRQKSKVLDLLTAQTPPKETAPVLRLISERG